MKYQKNSEIQKEYQKRYQEKRKRCYKAEKFLQQVQQKPYYIFTICHQNLYQPSVELIKLKKHHILTA